MVQILNYFLLHIIAYYIWWLIVKYVVTATTIITKNCSEPPNGIYVYVIYILIKQTINLFPTESGYVKILKKL